ncbi:unnamed protein product [Callosobruchus maculatus]|uniref:Uncharacterized protein n=1 Tax=Callosobruchus maculatus TaxID=64391 RepID=A0A653BX57_CALMS|nr:unnamed protein product [Callosobruchus maculatus]
MKLITNFVPLAFLLYTCSHLQTATSKNILHINTLEKLRRSCCSEDVALNLDIVAKDDIRRKEAYMSSAAGLNPNAYTQTEGNDVEKEVEKNPEASIKPSEQHNEHSMVSTPHTFGRNQHIKSKRSIDEKGAEITVRQKRAIGARPINMAVQHFLMSVPRKISRI